MPQLMIIGFLIVPLGGGVSFSGGAIRDLTENSLGDVFGFALLYLGWFLSLCGFVIMTAGIVLHWVMAVRGHRDHGER